MRTGAASTAVGGSRGRVAVPIPTTAIASTGETPYRPADRSTSPKSRNPAPGPQIRTTSRCQRVCRSMSNEQKPPIA